MARDVWDTVGVGDEKIEDVMASSKGGTDVDDLKVHIDKLEDILQEVKKQNNMKDEEIKVLRNKMLKMEKVLPLIGSPEQKTQGNQKSKEPSGAGASSKPENDVSKGDSGDLGKEERVSQLMNGDPAFRRGRLRWMRQEQIRFKNLQQQEITKQLRRQNVPHRFIPPENRKPRFPFKSNPKHRNSWSPGTHIIITEDEVIELRIPKEEDGRKGNKPENQEKGTRAASKDPQLPWGPQGTRSQDHIQVSYAGEAILSITANRKVRAARHLLPQKCSPPTVATPPLTCRLFRRNATCTSTVKLTVVITLELSWRAVQPLLVRSRLTDPTTVASL